MATHASVLAWRIPGTGEPGGLPSMGSQRVGHDWSDLAAAAAACLFAVNSTILEFWKIWFWQLSFEHVELVVPLGRPCYMFYRQLDTRVCIFLREEIWAINRNWEKGVTEDGITHSMDLNLSIHGEIVKDREAWHTAVHGLQRTGCDLNDWTITTMENARMVKIIREGSGNGSRELMVTKYKENQGFVVEWKLRR